MVAKSPLVSILMPVRNEEKNLPRSMESALRQTMGDLELVVSDNGSSDRSWETMMGYRKSDKRVKVFRNKNMGFTRSLNLLVRLASGKYIARLDADDEFLPEKLAKQIALMEGNKSASMVAGRCCVVDESGDRLYEHGPPGLPDEIRWSLIFRNEFWHSSVMWKSESNLRYDESFTYAQDYELWSRVAKNNDIISLQESVAKVKKRDGSITSTKSEDQKHFANAVSKRNMEYYLGREIPRSVVESVRAFHIQGVHDETARSVYEELKVAFWEKRQRTTTYSDTK